MDILLYTVIILILFAELINGWTDAPNAIATVVSTRVLSLKAAVTIAACCNIIGAFTGTAVAATIGTGIVKPESIDLVTLAGAIIAVIIWGMIAWYFALPTSKSHALISGIAGAGLAMGGMEALLWEGWLKVLLGLLFSTFLGMFSGWLIAKAIPIFFSHTSPIKSRKLFGKLQVLSASFMAFSHGSNDGQKFIGVFTLALFLGGSIPDFQIPYWVIIICALVMGIGTSIGGMRIIRTMGIKMVHLETYEGFSAETGSALTILTASHYGIPLSTTHTISMAIVGIGVAKPKRAVRWGVVRQIVYAWIVTFPFCGLLAFLMTIFLKKISNT